MEDCAGQGLGGSVNCIILERNVPLREARELRQGCPLGPVLDWGLQALLGSGGSFARELRVTSTRLVRLEQEEGERGEWEPRPQRPPGMLPKPLGGSVLLSKCQDFLWGWGCLFPPESARGEWGCWGRRRAPTCR